MLYLPELAGSISTVGWLELTIRHDVEKRSLQVDQLVSGARFWVSQVAPLHVDIQAHVAVCNGTKGAAAMAEPSEILENDFCITLIIRSPPTTNHKICNPNGCSKGGKKK